MKRLLQSAFGKRAAEAGEPHRDDQDGALEHELREGRGAEYIEAVETEHDDQRADERAEDVELAVAQRGGAEEDRGEGGEQVGIGGIGGAASQSRGEQGTGERRAHAQQHETEYLNAVDIDTSETRRGGVAADGL